MEYDKLEKPTEAQIDEIQKLANEKIIENVPVEIITVERKLAEETYRKVIKKDKKDIKKE